MRFFWRSRRDLNPRYPFGVHTISSRARYDHFDTAPYIGGVSADLCIIPQDSPNVKCFLSMKFKHTRSGYLNRHKRLLDLVKREKVKSATLFRRLPIFWRSRRDLNPRYPFGVHTISSRARYDHFDTAPCGTASQPAQISYLAFVKKSSIIFLFPKIFFQPLIAQTGCCYFFTNAL